MTKAFVDRLFSENDVVDVCARAHVTIQRRRDGAARLAPDLAIWLTQLDQGLFERHRPAIEVDADARAEFLEEPVPGRIADWAEVGENSLFWLRKLVRAELSRLFDRVLVTR